jgi:PAS domain S-box-containing protein
MVAEEVWQVNQGLREAMLLLQRRSEEHDKVERELRTREAHFHGLANRVPVMVWEADTTKACTYFNERWLKFTGRTLEEELGKGWTESVHPEDLDRRLKTYNEAFDRREHFTTEYRLRGADGVYRWVIDQGTPLFGTDGVFHGYVGGCMDISTRKQAEQALQRRCEDLERCLNERTSQLEEKIQSRKAAEEMLCSAKKDAEKKAQDSKDPSTFRATAALFAHEVANSLNGIFACLQLLDMKAQDLGGGDPELKSLVGSATEEIKRLGALLKDFRSFSQPQSYNFEPTDLRKMIDEVIAEDKLLYDSVGVRLKFEFPDTLLSITLDREKIKQAILRICKNAIEAMPSGGVLTFRGYESDGRMFLEIGDTGAGIPKGLEVFEPFRTTKPLSSGLGLPIVSQIISAHNGTIDYLSDLGKGTTFKIGLPAGRP